MTLLALQDCLWPLGSLTEYVKLLLQHLLLLVVYGLRQWLRTDHYYAVI
jgi:hypothetical protein